MMRRVDTLEQIHCLKDVGKDHVSFPILALTFHDQLSQVDLVERNQVQDVMLHQVVAPERMIIFVTSGTFRRFHSVQRIWRTLEQKATHRSCLH